MDIGILIIAGTVIAMAAAAAGLTYIEERNKKRSHWRSKITSEALTGSPSTNTRPGNRLKNTVNLAYLKEKPYLCGGKN